MNGYKPTKMEVQSNYFSCTLGEAASINKTHPTDFRTVGNLIEHQALNHPEQYAVAFPDPDNEGNDGWGSKLYTFRDLERASRMTEKEIGDLRDVYGKFQIIALLCPSSVDFLFTWLRLVRAGYAVLIIAPQCQPEAIAHLCKTSNSPVLLYHEQLSDKAFASANLEGNTITAIKIPWEITVDPTALNVTNDTPLFAHRSLEEDIAYIFHTSGTSSGLPKAIPQSHHAAVGVLPSLDGKDAATFTTTPLYHGGIADCFRAWSSQAMIWLFPGANQPITSRNILRSVAAAKRAEQDHRCPPVKYFCSVPYVLEMLSEDSDGLEMLKNLDLVGVGGAALSPALGDELVQAGVNLLSRFGSAECGFLLSSNRKFEEDRDWQYLRVPRGSQHLRFENQQDESGLSELVILKGWPHMAKVNQEDGSFATSDLFEPHANFEGAWKYHSRSDGQITLKTGKKFDPTPLEDEIRTSSSKFADVMIFGEGKQIPGLLIFPSVDAESDLADHVWGIVQDINNRSQEHTRISRNMILIIPPISEGLRKSSKGTILRKETEILYAQQIFDLYASENGASTNGVSTNGVKKHRAVPSPEVVRRVVKEIIKDITSRKEGILDTDDFYNNGIDSNQCTKIRGQLEKKLDLSLPWNVVYDCGNTERLVKYMISHTDFSYVERRGNGDQNSVSQEMHDLVDKFSVFNYTKSQPLGEAQTEADELSLVVLTGATGSLGVQILEILRNSPKLSQIICFVRAPSHKEARLRVSKSLARRNKSPLAVSIGRIVCVPSDFSKSDLGITPELYKFIQQKATHIIHSAWAVNFSLSLHSFESHFQGLQSLLTLGMSCVKQAQVLFCSSTASVLGPSHPPRLQESISSNPEDCDSLGYSKSKWIAEAICNQASQENGMSQRVKVLRIGQLTGDTENGIWNTSEAWPLMLSTVEVLGCLPRLDQKLTWLPTDVAANTVVEIGFGDASVSDHGSCLVYHVVNNNMDTSWNDLLGWIQKSGEVFEKVEMKSWLERLSALDSHPAKSLEGLWRRGSQSGEAAGVGITFDVARAESASESMKAVRAVDELLVGKIWGWLKNELALTRAGN